ncbi:Panacea domain-containing protein [Bacillus sp. JJ1562]|uniref:Panacea domain-containing protein n=1 Tax=Bacillus sp. JJ1562 TaxID=3122960 RepID=UPI0030024C0F
MVPAIQVAKYFILKSIPGTKQNITNLKLQKLLYYAQGHYLSNMGNPLFPDRIEAWVHGPVVPDVFKGYSHYNFNEIIENVDPTEIDEISSDISEFLDQVWDKYKNYNGKQLEKKTHREKPWLNIREGLPDFVYTNDEITRSSIKEYFDANHNLAVFV